jgi:hypothetical protein
MDHHIDPQISERLIKQIFGKMASKKFRLYGVSNFMPNEKEHFKSFVEEFRVSTDLQIMGKISIFGERQIGEPRIPIGNLENSANLNENLNKANQRMERNRNPNAIIEEETEEKVDNSEYYFELLKEQDFIKRLVDHHVPLKYLDHYKWLILNCRNREKIRSFRSLLNKVFLAEPVNTQDIMSSFNNIKI